MSHFLIVFSACWSFAAHSTTPSFSLFRKRRKIARDFCFQLRLRAFRHIHRNQGAERGAHAGVPMQSAIWRFSAYSQNIAESVLRSAALCRFARSLARRIYCRSTGYERRVVSRSGIVSAANFADSGDAPVFQLTGYNQIAHKFGYFPLGHRSGVVR
ncbi:MAG: hypothetical protein DMG14_10005 [Acidobacteria bacterium]|nr:MAG: hypothetical protein DMG14_10005 [Acidobacteriota bacterium]